MPILTPLSANFRPMLLAVPREPPVISACFPFSDIALLLLLLGMKGIERMRLPYTQKPRRVNNLRAARWQSGRARTYTAQFKCKKNVTHLTGTEMACYLCCDPVVPVEVERVCPNERIQLWVIRFCQEDLEYAAMHVGYLFGAACSNGILSVGASAVTGRSFQGTWAGQEPSRRGFPLLPQ